MDDTKDNQPADRSGAAGRIARKAAAPIVAAAASAAAAYAVRKAPTLIERTILPKLRDLAKGDKLRDLPERAKEVVPDRAKDAVQGAGDVAEQLTERVKAVTPQRGNGEDGSSSGARRTSPRERMKSQQARAQGRAERRKSVSRSGG
jgi:hypothetical protein